MGIRKLPIGIQDFEKLRTGAYVYVDKTAFIYRMASQGQSYFLGRPRRFGKSLLVSTMKAYFQGKRELFEEGEAWPGLAIADLEKEWKVHPVFHIDLTGGPYKDMGSLEANLDANLRIIEERWGRDTLSTTRFFGLIRRACESFGGKVVVLVDEYDKPLLETMEDPVLNEDIRKELKGF